MNTKKLILSLILGLGIMLPFSSAFAANYYVETAGDDGNDCATINTACLTIETAIAAATNGDTIYIDEGSYFGEGFGAGVQIDKAVNIDAWDTDGRTGNQDNVIIEVWDIQIPDTSGEAVTSMTISNVTLDAGDFGIFLAHDPAGGQTLTDGLIFDSVTLDYDAADTDATHCFQIDVTLGNDGGDDLLPSLTFQNGDIIHCGFNADFFSDGLSTNFETLTIDNNVFGVDDNGASTLTFPRITTSIGTVNFTDNTITGGTEGLENVAITRIPFYFNTDGGQIVNITGNTFEENISMGPVQFINLVTGIDTLNFSNNTFTNIAMQDHFLDNGGQNINTFTFANNTFNFTNTTNSVFVLFFDLSASTPSGDYVISNNYAPNLFFDMFIDSDLTVAVVDNVLNGFSAVDFTPAVNATIFALDGNTFVNTKYNDGANNNSTHPVIWADGNTVSLTNNIVQDDGSDSDELIKATATGGIASFINNTFIYNSSTGVALMNIDGPLAFVVNNAFILSQPKIAIQCGAGSSNATTNIDSNLFYFETTDGGEAEISGSDCALDGAGNITDTQPTFTQTEATMDSNADKTFTATGDLGDATGKFVRVQETGPPQFTMYYYILDTVDDPGGDTIQVHASDGVIDAFTFDVDVLDILEFFPDETSALVDAGNAAFAPAVDIIDTDRPQFVTDDIGAYEYAVFNTPPTVTIDTVDDQATGGDPITDTDLQPVIAWTFDDDDADTQASYQLVICPQDFEIDGSCDVDPTFDSGVIATDDASDAPDADLDFETEYFVNVTVNDGTDDTISDTVSFTTRAENTAPTVAISTIDSKNSNFININTQPEITWTFDDDDGDTQASYQLVICPQDFEGDGSCGVDATYDSGVVAANDTSGTPSSELEYSTTYYVNVTVSDGGPENDETISDTVSFTVKNAPSGGSRGGGGISTPSFSNPANPVNTDNETENTDTTDQESNNNSNSSENNNNSDNTENNSESGPFIDLKNHWVKNDVEKLVSQGILDEKEEFKPGDEIKRMDLSKIIVLAFLKDQIDEEFKTSFIDIQSKYSWALKYIGTLEKLGIVKGYPGNLFKPAKSTTRAQALKMILEAAGIKQKLDFESTSFTDTDGHWAKYYIETAHELGIVKGYEDGSFQPNKVINRAEAVSLITKVQTYLESK